MNQATPSTQQATSQPFQVTGTGGEYFRIWIVNLILSILTLGIYSAWAKVRTNRYFYGNTQIDNTGFEYHAKPLAILKGRLFAVALLLVYVLASQLLPAAGVAFMLVLLLATPWIIWKSMQFNARVTSFRNVRFGFYGSLKEVYRYLLVIPMLPLAVAALAGLAMWLVTGSADPGMYVGLGALAFVVTYLLVPFIQRAFTGYYIDNHRYGQGLLQADLSTRKYYLIYLALLGWSLLIFAAIAVSASMAMAFSGFNLMAMASTAEGELQMSALAPLIVVTVFMYVAFLIAGVWIKAYLKARIRNHVYSNIQLDNIARLESTITTGRLFRFYLVNILLMICTLGLAWPWIKVRTARLMAMTTQAHVTGSLDQYVSLQQSRQSALGDEIGEAFDVDADLDLAF